MRLFIGCCLVIGLIISCSDKDRIPRGVLPQEEMQKVMWDMIQADRFSAQFLLKDSAKRNVKAEMFTLYEDVFKLHNISRETFTKSYHFYVSRPDIARVMFDSLVVQTIRARDAANADTTHKQAPELPQPAATLKKELKKELGTPTPAK